MNQKTFFSVLAAFIAIQAIILYFNGSQMATTIYPDLNTYSLVAASATYRFAGAIFLVLALVTFGVRAYPGALWAYTLGFTFMTLHAIKVVTVDGIAVPVLFIVFNLAITLLCGYLWMQNRKTKPDARSRSSRSAPAATVALLLCGLTIFSFGCTDALIASGDTQEADSFAAKQTLKTVPLKGSMTALAVGDLPQGFRCPPGTIPAPVTSSGNLSHLGRTTLTGAACNDVSAFPNITVSGGQAVFRAANGDEVHLAYAGNIQAGPVCEVSSVLDFSATITGGTGRFEGASGEVNITGIGVPFACPPDSDPPPGYVEAFVDGYISSVGSSRK